MASGYHMQQLQDTPVFAQLFWTAPAVLEPCFSKCDARSSSIGVAWAFAEKRNILVPTQRPSNESSDNSFAHYSLKSTGNLEPGSENGFCEEPDSKQAGMAGLAGSVEAAPLVVWIKLYSKSWLRPYLTQGAAFAESYSRWVLDVL